MGKGSIGCKWCERGQCWTHGGKGNGNGKGGFKGGKGGCKWCQMGQCWTHSGGKGGSSILGQLAQLLGGVAAAKVAAGITRINSKLTSQVVSLGNFLARSRASASAQTTVSSNVTIFQAPMGTSFSMVMKRRATSKATL